jgi:heme exporter protein D
MQWESFADFWAMGGRGFYVWGAYIVTVVFIVVEIVLVRRRRQNAIMSLQRADQSKRLEEHESQT